MKTVTVKLLPKQKEFLECKSKWAAARGGVGSGKTTAMIWWLIRRLEDFPKANHVVVGADYEQLRRGFFQSLIGVLEEDLGWQQGTDYIYRESPTPLLRFKHNGARLRSMSAELAQRVRSVEIQTLYCEEAPTWHNGRGDDTFKTIANRLRPSRKSSSLYPKLRECGRMTFNPPATGTWLWDMIERRWPKEGYPCWRFSLRENFRMARLDEYIKNVEIGTPEHRWRVEIDGEWATVGNGFFYEPDIRAAIREELTKINRTHATDRHGEVAHCELYPDGKPWHAVYPDHTYVHFWDIAKNMDWCVGRTLDVSGGRLVAVEFQRFNQIGYDGIEERIRERHRRYQVGQVGLEPTGTSKTYIDRTGVGEALMDRLRDIGVEGLLFTKQTKDGILSDLQVALSTKTLEMPEIPVEYNELRSYERDDKALTQDCVMALAGAVHFGWKRPVSFSFDF